MRTCWICAGEFAEDFPLRGEWFEVDCRTCGKYLISAPLNASRFPMPDSERYRLSYWCKQRQLDGREPPYLDSYAISAIIAQLETPRPSSKADLLLVSLGKKYPVPGTYLESLDTFRDYSLACARNGSELSFFQSVLMRRELIRRVPGGDRERLEITEDGWDRIESLSNVGTKSKFAFVAMKFSEDMLALWKPAFYTAIEKAGFDPLLANDPAHNERIDARIVADIRRSRFVVADVTHRSPGVYFEAGYALGLGRPVIWTCRNDCEADMHFDTRQYNHILWKDHAELAEELYARIAATI